MIYKYSKLLSPQVRIEKLSIPVTESGCHVWIGSSDKKGYGKMAMGTKRIYAHRLAYELKNGPIPNGLQIDHLCRVPGCVNADHLEAVTQRTNLMRSPRNATIRAQLRTHCPSGHEFTEKNTYWYRTGGRGCRTCNREAARRLAAI